MVKALTWAVGADAIAPRTAQKGDHRASACRDPHCLRPLCVVYKEGFADGWDDCYPEAWEAGYAAKVCPSEK